MTKKFAMTLEIVFIVHLIPVLFIATSVSHYGEAEAWWLFMGIDFPCSLLVYIACAICDMSSQNVFWRLIVYPAVFFQIIGVLNWMLIIYGVRTVIGLLTKK